MIEGLDDILRLRAGLGGVGEGAGEAGAGLARLESPLEVVKNNAGKLAAAFVTLVAAYGLKESADYAARTEVLGTTLGVVAKTAGYSTGQMAGYEVEVKKLGITTQATREALTQMIQAGLEIGPAAAGQVSQVAKLARAAQDLAVVTGESSSQTLTRLITNIQQMDTMGLRYMGLTVDIGQAQERFALSIGKTTEQLTQQQKTQAVANAALEQASTLSGAYEASMRNVGKQLSSLSRYQEELANSIGEKLLPAYFELVKSATAFLKVAEQTVKESDKSGQGARDLAEGVKGFFTGLSKLFNAVLTVGADIYPVFETVLAIFLEFTGEVLAGVAAILQLGDAVDATGKKTSALGAAIKDTVIIPLGILIAGLKDGFTFIGAMIGGLTGAALDFAGVFLQALGKVVGYFNTDLGKALTGAGDQLRETAKGLIGFADDTVAKFGRGETALGKFNAKLGESKALTESLVKASNYGDIEEQIRKLTEAKRLGHLNDVELKKDSDEVAAAITRMGGAMDASSGKTRLSAEEVQRLNTALLNVTKNSSVQFTDAINNMGLQLKGVGGTEYLVPLNKQFAVLSKSVVDLADNANTTSTQFQIAFSKGLDSAKTVSDIGQIADSLTNARNAGKELGESNTLLAARFEEVFAASLKAAKTKVDFELLNDQVVMLGREGKVSGDLIALALDQIRDKATGAGDEIARMGKQATAAAQSVLTAAKAHLALVTAEADVGRARIGVWQAQNQYARDGSELSREALRLAQLNLTLAQAKAEQARLQYAQEQQANNVLIAQQKEINALARLKLDLGNAALIKAVEAAAKEVEGAKASFEITRQKVIKQQESVLAIEEQVVKQKLLVDASRAAADETKKIADGLKRAAGNAGSVTENLLKGVSALEQQNAAQERLNSATEKAIALENKRRGVDSQGFSADANGNRISTSVPTKRGVYDQAKSSGLSEGEALGIANKFIADNGQQIGWGGANVRAGENWGTELQKAIDTIVLAKANATASANRNGGLNTSVAPSQSTGSSGFEALSNQLLDQIKTSSPVSLSSRTVQSLASQSPSKVIQVNFTNDRGQSVPVTVDAANEGALLALLQKAKGVAS
ncbi:MAG: hypothetical protein GZ090_01400 [Oxalobacteraceae bacterium]|nr:hypothetical protein [Oxalobacteraceae bacterium]